MRIFMASLTLLALAACGEAPEKPAARPVVTEESGAAKEVAALSEPLRNGVFAKAIRESGETGCLSVTKSERAKMMNGAPGWKAECDNGSAHLIEIAADGTAKVTSRTH